MAQKHWDELDFVVTSTSPAYDGSNTVNEVGYCRKCLCDMQSFGKNGEKGLPRHYGSHKIAKRLNFWGKSNLVSNDLQI